MSAPDYLSSLPINKVKRANNYQLSIAICQLFSTFAPAFRKSTVYTLLINYQKVQMNQYETVFILTPVLSDEQMKETVAKFKGILTDKGAEIVNEETWGLKKMAYPIEKKSTGFYCLIEFKAEPEVIKTLETAYRRDEKVIRYMIVKLDKYAVAYAEKRRAKLAKKEEA